MRLKEALLAQDQALSKASDWLQAGQGRVLLITGAEGSGKRSLAHTLAALLLCENAAFDEACGQCQACLCLAAQTHPDLIWLRPDADERLLKVAQLRELLQDTVPVRPQFGRFKLCLIDADSINEQGQNALLKSLEEPPPYMYFILTVSSEEKLLPTVRSRAVPLRLAPLTADELAAFLRKKGRDDSLAAPLVALTNGSPGKSLDLLDSDYFLEMRAALWALLKQLPKRPPHRLLSEDYAFFEQEKEHYDECLDLLRSFLRDLLLLAAGGDARQVANRDLASELCAFYEAGHYTPQRLEIPLKLISDLLRGRKVNENFEMAVCRLLLCLREQLLV